MVILGLNGDEPVYIVELVHFVCLYGFYCKSANVIEQGTVAQTLLGCYIVCGIFVIVPKSKKF